MSTILDLENLDHLQFLNAQWRYADGLVPGEPNGGLVDQLAESPARLAEYDDSSWDIIDDIQKGRSKGFCFGWYRMTVTLPDRVDGGAIAGKTVYFETCVDDYGELWIDGECDKAFGESGRGCVSGFNAPQRVKVCDEVQVGAKHTLAILAVNGPFAKPGGGIFLRYARLVIE